jgi:hypothetical protein
VAGPSSDAARALPRHGLAWIAVFVAAFAVAHLIDERD